MYGTKIQKWGRTYEDLSVIGGVETTPNGNNVVLRIGRTHPEGWEQTEHVVLTPDEVAGLTVELLQAAYDAIAAGVELDRAAGEASLRPRPGETAEDVLARVTKAVTT